MNKLNVTLLLFSLVILTNVASSADYGSITMREDANITLDGGFIKNFQSDGQFNILAYGATPDDFTDDAAAIQDCYDAANEVYEATGRFQTVNWPPGEFNGNSSHGYTNDFTIVEPRPGTVTEGAGMGVTVFRAADNLRDATHGVYLFRNDIEYCDHFSIKDITFEYGNNTVQAGESNWTSIGALYASNVLVENVEVLNVSGYWALQFGRIRETANSTNAHVSNVHIYNAAGSSIAGDATADHSSVRFDMDNVIFRDSLLECETKPANGAAFEFHGNNSTASGIVVINYKNGVNMGADQWPHNCNVSNQRVLHSSFRNVSNGIILWTLTADSVLSDVTNIGNDILISEAGVGFSATDITNLGTIRNVRYFGNDVSATSGSYHSYGGLFQDVDNLDFRENSLRNLTNGLYVLDTEYIGVYDISANDVLHWGHGVTNGQQSSGIYLDIRPSVDGGHLIVDDNHMVGDNYPHYGILTYCPNLTDISMRGNDISGCTVQDIVEAYTWRTDEDLYISHSSRNHTPLDSAWAPSGAIDGSEWVYQGNGTKYRMDSTWRRVAWTYE